MGMRLFAMFILCLSAPNLFPQDEAKAPYVEKEERVFNFFPGGKIEISAGAPGSLKIVGWQKGSVRVEIEKIVYYHAAEQAQAEAKKSRVRVRWEQTNATIQTAPSASATIEINLTVYVPGQKTDIVAKMNRGDFSIEGVNGWIETTILTEGSIEAKSLAGYFSGKTPHGDVNAELTGKRWDGLEFAALTQSGSASLLLPVDFSAALQLEARHGKVSVDYPNQVVQGEEVPPDILVGKTSQSLKASVGDGGAPIKLITMSGDVSLKKKE